MNLLSIKHNFLKNWETYCLALLIIIGLFLRFYNYPYRYGLGDETVRDAAVAIVGVREFQAPLTGSFSSAGPFTFGPWYYYQLIFFRALLPLSYSAWIYLSIASVTCIYLSFKIGETLLNKRLGILFAFLLGISPSLILAGTHLTNPNLSNVFAFFSIYVFLKLVKRNVSYWWGFVLGVTLGIAINIHYQMFGLLVLPILLILVKPKKYLNFVCCIAGLVITFIPLILFDLNNHLFNFRNMFYYYTEGKKLIYVPNRWLFYVRDFWPSYIEEVTGLPKIISMLSSISFVIFTAYLIYKRKITKLFLLLLVSFVINFILLRYYWGERFFAYLNYIRPFILIFEGLLIYSLLGWIKQKRVKAITICLVAIGLLVLNFPKITEQLKEDGFTKNIYSIKTKLLDTYPNEKFTLYICPGPGNTYYSAREHSLLFLLDSQGLLSLQGRPITFNNDDCFSSGVRRVQDYRFEATNFIKIPNTGLIDLSRHNEASISAMGWQRHSLKLIYNTTTRWWFSEQP